MGAVQSQDHGPAKWSLAQRTAGLDDESIQRSFDEGSILRTHVLRPTWHFVTPDDIRWVLDLTGPRVQGVLAHYYRREGLDEELRGRTNSILEKALGNESYLTRKEIQQRLAGAGIQAGGMILGFLLGNAELEGLICSGPMRGKQHTFALLEERAPSARKLPREEAVAELTRRYFTSHGPATAKDFRWWSSLTLTDIKNGIESVKEHLIETVVDDISYWSAPLPSSTPPNPPKALLLQGYDEYIVGYSESKWLLDISRTGAPGNGSTFIGVILLGTQVRGSWKRTITKDSVHFELAPSPAFDESQLSDVQREAERHAAFLGLPSATVQLVRATAG